MRIVRIVVGMAPTRCSGTISPRWRERAKREQTNPERTPKPLCDADTCFQLALRRTQWLTRNEP